MKHITKVVQLALSMQGGLRGFLASDGDIGDGAIDSKEPPYELVNQGKGDELIGDSLADNREGYTNPFGVYWFGDDPREDTPHLLVYQIDPSFCAAIDTSAHGTAVALGDPLIIVKCNTTDDRQLFFLEDEKRWRPGQNLELCVGVTDAEHLDPEGYALKVEACVLKNPRQRWNYWSSISNDYDEMTNTITLIKKASDPTQWSFSDFCVSHAGTNTIDNDGPGGHALQLRALRYSCNKWSRVTVDRYNIGSRYTERWAGDDPDDLETLIALDRDQVHCIAVNGKIQAGAKLKLDLCDATKKTEAQLWFVSDRHRWRPASDLSLCVGASNAPIKAIGFQPELEACDFPQKRQKWEDLCLKWEDEVDNVSELCIGAINKESGENVILIEDEQNDWRTWSGDSDRTSSDEHMSTIYPVLIALDRDRNYCISALELSEGSELVVIPCNEADERQLWLYEHGWGRLFRPAARKGLCVGVSGASLDTWKTAFRFRPRLEQCGEHNSRQQWREGESGEPGGSDVIVPLESSGCVLLSYVNSPGLPDGAPIQLTSIHYEVTRWVTIDPGEYKAPGYDGRWVDQAKIPHLLVLRDDRSLCLAAENVAPGEYLEARKCDVESSGQLWLLHPGGQEAALIRSGGNPALCIGIEGIEDAVTDDGYQAHPARPRLESCAQGNHLLLWTFEAGSGDSPWSYSYSGMIRPHFLRKLSMGKNPAVGGKQPIFLRDYSRLYSVVASVALFSSIDPEIYVAPGRSTSNFLSPFTHQETVLVVVESKPKFCLEASTENEAGFLAVKCNPDSIAQRWEIDRDTIRAPFTKRIFYYNKAWNHEISDEVNCLSLDEISLPIDEAKCGKHYLFQQRYLLISTIEYRHHNVPKIASSSSRMQAQLFQIRSAQNDLCLFKDNHNGVKVGRCFWNIDKYTTYSKEQTWLIEELGNGFVRMRPRSDLSKCLTLGLLSIYQDFPSLALGLCVEYDETQKWQYNKHGNTTISHNYVPGYLVKGDLCVGWSVPQQPPPYEAQLPIQTEAKLVGCNGEETTQLQWQLISADFCEKPLYSDTDVMVVYELDQSKCIERASDQGRWSNELLDLVDCNDHSMSQIWTFDASGKWRAKYDPSYCVGERKWSELDHVWEQRVSETKSCLRFLRTFIY